MTIEVHALEAFYASAGGEAAARLVRARLASLWPSLPGMTVLGIGHAAPYLGLWQAEARACLALTTAHVAHGHPPAAWPPNLPGAWPGAARPSATLVAEEEALPFADASIDRILLVHGLEAAENARRLLREAWRVLRDDGRLIIVVPNRLGLWAQLERTPFGHGQPYSSGQLTRLLGRHLFRVEARDAALFLPPYGLRLLRATAPAMERVGRAICPRIAGVAIVEAEKDLFSAMPAGAVAFRRRRVMMPAAA
ncbi:class I SAM-dependent methyltransferase [Falsiroseomonas stagni]|uniref:Methyltransferase domain-containing protein n=1 Tax=Falsiroseomonas stagni DSM 19981 TaxID=1123062 RepID=A0A1I3XLV8_9PROT|nr:methyltransferase domain-containing protein [Falsiroseomonas stagni]SFK20554.1 Methyltransferase domain-containing protein [Falsiroseomonas stagni DSM 19981]